MIALRQNLWRTQQTSASPFFLGVALAVLASSSATGQEKVAPFYALPTPGVWVEFDCVDRGPAGKELQSTLRLSHVGQVDIQGKAHVWVEIKMAPKSKDAANRKLRKLLVDEESYRQSGDLAKSIKVAYQQSGPSQPARPLASASLSSFLQLGFPTPLPLTKTKVEEETETPLGKWRCQKVHISANAEGRSLKYEALLCKEVPFGICRFSVTEGPERMPSQTEFRAVVSRTGTKARSELISDP